MSFNFEFALKHGASETVELKEQINSPELIARYISAFSNTNGGAIIVGVREPILAGVLESSYVVGVSENKLKRYFETALHRIIGPAKTKIEFRDIEGKKVGLIHVQMSRGIVGTFNGIFRREGEKTTLLTAENIVSRFRNGVDIEESLSYLSEIIFKENQEITRMSSELAKINSWNEKLLFISIGAFIGAVTNEYIPLFYSLIGAITGYSLITHIMKAPGKAPGVRPPQSGTSCKIDKDKWP